MPTPSSEWSSARSTVVLAGAAAASYFIDVYLQPPTSPHAGPAVDRQHRAQVGRHVADDAEPEMAVGRSGHDRTRIETDTVVGDIQTDDPADAGDLDDDRGRLRMPYRVT